jgi:deoxyhypusine monooxygenase
MPAACACLLNPYSSVDPAPAASRPHRQRPFFFWNWVIFFDVDEAIFERYRAMFSLRNRGGEAVLQLCRALTKTRLRHY